MIGSALENRDPVHYIDDLTSKPGEELWHMKRPTRRCRP